MDLDAALKVKFSETENYRLPLAIAGKTTLFPRAAQARPEPCAPRNSAEIAQAISANKKIKKRRVRGKSLAALEKANTGEVVRNLAVKLTARLSRSKGCARLHNPLKTET